MQSAGSYFPQISLIFADVDLRGFAGSCFPRISSLFKFSLKV